MFFGPSAQLINRAESIDFNSQKYITAATVEIQENQRYIFEFLFEDKTINLEKFWLVAESACASYIVFLLHISKVKGKDKLMDILDKNVSKFNSEKKVLTFECSSYINQAVEQTTNMPATDTGKMLMVMMFYGEWIRSKIHSNGVSRSSPVLYAMNIDVTKLYIKIAQACLANTSGYWIT